MLEIQNRQRKVRVDLEWMRRFGVLALEKCLKESANGLFALRNLPQVDVAIVSDAVIAKVHLDFMGIPGATDVITFEHGEIVISAETARDNAKVYGHRFQEELALYLVHGLLHLNGFEDGTAAEARRMGKVQERVLAKCLTEMGARGEKGRKGPKGPKGQKPARP